MRGCVKPLKKYPNYRQWQLWFAWYPVRAWVGETGKCWVWLEIVETRYGAGFDHLTFEYQVRDHGAG